MGGGACKVIIVRLNHEFPRWLVRSVTCTVAASTRRRSELAKIEKLTRQIQRLLQDVKRFQYLLHGCPKLVSMHATGDMILEQDRERWCR